MIENPGSEREETEMLRVSPLDNLDLPRGLNPKAEKDYEERFLPEAKRELIESVRHYAEDVIQGSVTVQSRHQNDAVSAIHVIQAALILQNPPPLPIPPPSRLRKLAGILGGILLGTAISNVCNMMQDNSFPQGLVVITVIAAAVGPFLVAFDLGGGARAS